MVGDLQLTIEAEAEAARRLRAAETPEALARVWFRTADGLDDHDPSRGRLREVYIERLRGLGALHG